MPEGGDGAEVVGVRDDRDPDRRARLGRRVEQFAELLLLRDPDAGVVTREQVLRKQDVATGVAVRASDGRQRQRTGDDGQRHRDRRPTPRDPRENAGNVPAPNGDPG